MPQNVATDLLHITDWVKGLVAIPERDFSLENARRRGLRGGLLPVPDGDGCFPRRIVHIRRAWGVRDQGQIVRSCRPRTGL